MTRSPGVVLSRISRLEATSASSSSIATPVAGVERNRAETTSRGRESRGPSLSPRSARSARRWPIDRTAAARQIADARGRHAADQHGHRAHDDRVASAAVAERAPPASRRSARSARRRKDGVGTPLVAVLTIMSDTRAANDMAFSPQRSDARARPLARTRRIS